MAGKDYGYKSIGVTIDVFEAVHEITKREKKKIYDVSSEIMLLGLKIYAERFERMQKFLGEENGL